MSHPASLLFLAFLWTGWCLMHSLLITATARKFFKRHLGARFAWFRIGYNIFSLITLVPVVYLHLRLQGRILLAWSGPWQMLRLLLFIAAGLLFYGGARTYDLGYFLGLEQVLEYQSGRENRAAVLRTNGILAYVRHPWYAAGILVVWVSGPITAASLVAKVVLSGYLPVGAILEERKLVAEFGESYRQYQRRVNMLIPWPGKGKRENR